MASGSGRIGCLGTAYSHYEYSYSTREDSNNIYFDLRMTFHADTSGAVQTQLGPGWMTWLANGWSFNDSAYGTIAEKGGQAMRNAVAAAGGVQQYWQTSESYVTHPAGVLFTHNLTLTIAKGTSDRTDNIKFSVAVQSSFYWDTFAANQVITIPVFIPAKYKPVSGLVLKSSEIGTNTFKISASWTPGIESDGRVYVTVNSVTKLINDDPVVFTEEDGIVPNTYYTISGRLCDATHSSSNFETKQITLWTYPVINDPILSLRKGSEHNTIDVTVTANVASEYDQFAYKLNANEWSSWSANKSHSFSGLSENTEYTITVKMKNTQSNYESTEKTAKIRTWYNPISNLSVVLKNKWFWYLQIGCNFNYNGTITKYEYAVGDDEKWVDKGTTNIHSRGSATPGASGNLNYNTNYTCWVRLTDNHGRTAQASAVFKTLDERPLYVDGQLREVKVIASNGTVTYITPNLLSVIKEDGTLVNMNKIINNDNRTQFQ